MGVLRLSWWGVRNVLGLDCGQTKRNRLATIFKAPYVQYIIYIAASLTWAVRACGMGQEFVALLLRLLGYF